jgi:uncharacterized membrane protein HdeD (DUF308 family)
MAVAVSQKGANLWWIILLQGIATLIIGFLLLTAPAITVTTLVFFLGAYWFVDGIFSIIRIFLKDSELHWGWLLVRGILGILAGLYVLRHPLVSAVFLPTTLVIVLAIQGIIMGVIGLIEAFRGGGWGAGLLGVINIIIGIILLGSPMLTAVFALPLVFGIMGIVFGIILIVSSFKLKSA